MTLDAIIAALDAAEKKATPAQWVVEMGDKYITGHIVANSHTYVGNSVERSGSVCAPASLTVNDADFIVLARNHMRTLIEAVKVYQKYLAENQTIHVSVVDKAKLLKELNRIEATNGAD